MRKLTRKLLQKSKEAFLLSLELFNKPTISYRTESFSIFFSNAWELLSKAYIFETSGGKKLSIFRRKKRNQKRESRSLDECLKKVFLRDNNPIRRNIEYISEIRNEASHLIIIELDPFFSRVFQRGVLNYVEHLEKWFNMRPSEVLKPGLISLVSDEPGIIDLAILRRRFNKEDFQSINSWINKFKELEKLGDKATISIDYTIAITKNLKKADIVLSAGKKGTKAIILEKFRDIDQTHPYRRKEAMKQILSRLKKRIKFTTYNFEAYCFVNGIKKVTKNEYYWKPRYNPGQYSGKLIDDIVSTLNTNPASIKKFSKQYAMHFKKHRKKI